MHRGWLMVAAGLVCSAAAIGLVQNTFSLFLAPVCEELGFTRSQMSINQTIMGIGMMAVGFLWGPLFSKYRLKRLMSVAAAVTCVCYFMYSLVGSIIAFYALSTVLSISTALLAWTPLTAIIGNWFNEKRGLAIGIAFMGSGVGGMLFNALGGVLIASVGWRSTFMINAAIMVFTVLPTVLFVLKVKPEDVGLEPYGGYASSGGEAGEKSGMTLGQAYKGSLIYVLCGCALLIGFCMNSMNLTTAPNIEALGYSPVFAAGVASAYMAALAVAKIVLGAMCDRIGTWKGCAVSLIALLVAVVCAALARFLPFVFVMVVANGLGTSFGSVAYPLMARDIYGEKDQAAIAGVISSVGSLGGSFGPTICGMVYDATGAYTPAYIVIAAMTVVFGGLVILSMARNAGKWKEKTI